jgi:hypothetical protein
MTERIYAGTLCKRACQGKPVYNVCFGKTGAFDKRFSISKYGSDEAAFAAAETYRNVISDRENLTVLRPSMDGFWETISDLTPSERNENEVHMFIAGFMDGDGSISLSSTYDLRVEIGQSCNEKIPLVMEWLGSLFESTIYSHKHSHPGRRMTHRIQPLGKNARRMLDIMLKYCVLKSDQAEKALQFLDGEISPQIAYEYLKQAKEVKTYQAIDIDKSRLTLSYIAGLFDAEGCVDVIGSTCIRARIAQQQSPKLLYLLTELFPGGRVEQENQISWEAENATRILRAIEIYTVHKRSQILCALKLREYLPIHHSKRNSDDKRHIKDLCDYIIAEKRN